MISLEPVLQHTHPRTHTHLMSPRLRLLVYPCCPGDSQWPWQSVSPRSLVSAAVWGVCGVYVHLHRFLSAAECMGWNGMGDLVSDLPEHASLMNSSVTQLIAKPAAVFSRVIKESLTSAGFVQAWHRWPHAPDICSVSVCVCVCHPEASVIISTKCRHCLIDIWTCVKKWQRSRIS